MTYVIFLFFSKQELTDEADYGDGDQSNLSEGQAGNSVRGIIYLCIVCLHIHTQDIMRQTRTHTRNTNTTSTTQTQTHKQTNTTHKQAHKSKHKHTSIWANDYRSAV